MKKYHLLTVLIFLLLTKNYLSQCVTTSLTLGSCSLTGQSFTNQAGANNGTAPNATCGWGTGSGPTSTWVRFTYVGPPTQQYLEGSQVAGGSGNNPAIAIYSNNGCTLLGCSSSNSSAGPTEAAADGKIDLTTLGLTVGQSYLIRVYNEGNTANVKNPSIRCIPTPPPGDCFTNPVIVGNINTSFSSSTFSSNKADCCTFPINNLGAVTQLNCAGPGQISVDGNMWYKFTVCTSGLVTATATTTGCNSPGLQIWFLQGNCNGGTANFTNLDCITSDVGTTFVTDYNCTAGQTYYIMVDSYGGNICNFNMVLTGPICIVLPVTLISFNGEYLENDKVSLTWETSSERENDHFILQKAKHSDKPIFETIKTIDGIGSSSVIKNYSYVDLTDGQDYYYRLLQQDDNGQIDSLKTIHVSKSQTSDYINSIYKNNESQLEINYYSSEDYKVIKLRILNILGQEVYMDNLVVKNKGNNVFKIDINKVDGKIYYIELQNTRNNFNTKIFNY